MIPDVDANVRILSGGRRLEIVSATTRDTAEYRCVASNPAGTISRDFSLFVFGESTFLFPPFILNIYTCIVACQVIHVQM